MKICLINNLYHPYARGGAEKIVALRARELSDQGHNVKIISGRPLFSKPMLATADYYLPSCYFNLTRVPIFLRLFWHIFDAFDFITAWKVKRILKIEKCDLVITHNLKGLSFLIPRVVAKLKIEHHHTLHDIQLLHPSGLLLHGKERKIKTILANVYIKINQFLFNSPQKIISPSKWLLDLHRQNGFFQKSLCVVMQNPTESKKNIVSTNFELPSGTQDKFKFLYLGQMEDHKGVYLLLKTFLNLKIDNVVLIFAGDGKELLKLKKMANGAQNVIFLGRIDGARVPGLMRACDCLVVPSLCYENSPTVIYEAKQNNLPIVASRLGGIPELLDDDQLFIPNENDLARKIVDAIGTEFDKNLNL